MCYANKHSNKKPPRSKKNEKKLLPLIVFRAFRFSCVLPCYSSHDMISIHCIPQQTENSNQRTATSKQQPAKRKKDNEKRKHKQTKNRKKKKEKRKMKNEKKKNFDARLLWHSVPVSMKFVCTAVWYDMHRSIYFRVFRFRVSFRIIFRASPHVPTLPLTFSQHLVSLAPPMLKIPRFALTDLVDITRQTRRCPTRSRFLKEQEKKKSTTKSWHFQELKKYEYRRFHEKKYRDMFMYKVVEIKK